VGDDGEAGIVEPLTVRATNFSILLECHMKPEAWLPRELEYTST